MDDMRKTIRRGQITYQLFLVATLITLLVLLISPFWTTLISWIITGVIIAGGAIWTWSQLIVNKALDEKYNSFWSTLPAGSKLSLRGRLRSLGL